MTSTIETEDVELLAALRTPEKPLPPYELYSLGALCRTAADTIERLREENARLRDAVRPFAQHVGKSGEAVTLSIGKDTWTHTLTTDDFSRARAALNQQ